MQLLISAKDRHMAACRLGHIRHILELYSYSDGMHSQHILTSSTWLLLVNVYWKLYIVSFSLSLMVSMHQEIAGLYREVTIVFVIHIILLSIMIHSFSPRSSFTVIMCCWTWSRCKRKKKHFCTEIYFLWRICKKKIQRNKLLNMLYFLWLMM